MITVNIAFKDRDYWIKQIDKMLSESDQKSYDRFQKRLAEFNKYNWLERWLLAPAPTLELIKQQDWNGLATLKNLKEVLEKTNWETISISEWVFNWVNNG